MKNFVSHGSTVEWTNGGSAVLAGAVVIVGHLVGIAVTDIGAGATGTVQIEGVFEVDCNTGDTITQGMKLDWDASASEFVDNIASPATGDNTDGVIAVADDAGATVLVKLLPGHGTTA
jgi:predicted RecA/RadA family phage recombinase